MKIRLTPNLRKSVAAMATVCLVATASACGSDSNSDAGAGADKISIAYFTGSMEGFPIEIMKSKKIFEDNGLAPEFVKASSGPALTSALASGSVNIGTGYPALYLPAMSAGKEFTVAAPYADPLAYFIVGPAGSGIADPGEGLSENAISNLKKLKGKTVGVTAVGAQTQIYAEILLREAGVNPKDVTFVATGGAATAMGAFKSKQVDYLVTWPPMTGLLAEEKIEFDRVVGSTTELPKFQNLRNVLWLANSSFARENPDVVTKFCGAMVDARAFITDETNKAEVIKMLKQANGVNDVGATEIYDNWLFMYDNEPSNFLSKDVWNAQGDYLAGTENENFAPDYESHVIDSCMESGK